MNNNHKTKYLSCPFCGIDPPLCVQNAGAPEFQIFIVGCENDECHANPQVSGYTIEEAWKNWNTRNGRTPAEQEMDRHNAAYEAVGAGGLK